MVESLLTDHRPDALKKFNLLAVHLDKDERRMADLNERIARFVSVMGERARKIVVMSLEGRAPVLRPDQVRVPTVNRIPKSEAKAEYVLAGWYLNICVRMAHHELVDRGTRTLHIPLNLTQDDHSEDWTGRTLHPDRIEDIAARYETTVGMDVVPHAIYIDGKLTNDEKEPVIRTFFYSSAAHFLMRHCMNAG